MSRADDQEDIADAAVLERVASRALEVVGDAVLLGLGSGRAAAAFIRALGVQVRAGRRARGVPTSEQSARLAREVGIPLTGLEEAPLEVTVDGADEVDPDLDLIKGYGGALVRERIVAAASRRQVILVGHGKLVPVLGSRGRLPVEVLPFALPLTLAGLRGLGCGTAVRMVDGGRFLTDNGNVIVDCAIGPIADPSAFERRVRTIPGVIDTGFFLGTADLVLVGGPEGVRALVRKRRG